jgi:hypothetical protein
MARVGPALATTRRCVHDRRLDREMSNTAPLFDDEYVIAEGVVRSRTHRTSVPRLSYLRVSSRRICLVQRFAFRRDRLIEIPAGAAVERVRRGGQWVHADVNHVSGRLSIALRPWGRTVDLGVGPVLRCSPDELREVLDRRS